MQLLLVRHLHQMARPLVVGRPLHHHHLILALVLLQVDLQAAAAVVSNINRDVIQPGGLNVPLGASTGGLIQFYLNVTSGLAYIAQSYSVPSASLASSGASGTAAAATGVDASNIALSSTLNITQSVAQSVAAAASTNSSTSCGSSSLSTGATSSTSGGVSIGTIAFTNSGAANVTTNAASGLSSVYPHLLLLPVVVADSVWERFQSPHLGLHV